MELGGAFTIFLALCLSCLLVLIAWKRINKRGKLPPGPTPIPFLGNLLQISPNAPFQCLMKLRKKYGPMFTVYLGPWPVVILCGHELVKEALVDGADEFSGCGEMAILDKNFQGHGAPIDRTFFLSRTVSNVISSVFFGSCFDYEDKEFLNLLPMINESFIEMSTPWAKLYEMYSGIMQYLPGRHKHLYYVIEDLKDFVASRVKINEEKNNPHTEFKLKNLVITTLNLFFAGTETVSSTLRYGFLLLMKHPEVEDKIHKEINQVIGPHRMPRVEERVKMPYTDAVIHEIQRLTDIVPMGKRICLGEALARMELFLYFTSILQNFSLRSLVPMEDIDITPRKSGFGNIPPTLPCGPLSAPYWPGKTSLRAELFLLLPDTPTLLISPYSPHNP
ncbi:cytochrome P450 2G1-like [Marmota flaviventris]|uniref:cytochrome P450 2G1-like n=1 Tax=Marmota flaviventris TaxID=93162 RepID=UPI003A8B9536